MDNFKLAEIFNEMADILEMQNVEWKPRAYRQAARSLESLKEPVRDVFKRGGLKLIEDIPGVGEGIGKKIVEFLETGKVKEFERLKKAVPAHVDVLLKVPSLGPKKVKKLNAALNVSTVAQLEKAAKLHKIASLEGFGEQSEKDILASIELMRSSKDRIPLKEAELVADKIISELNKLKEVKNVSAAGSLRRKKSSVRDVDIVVSSNEPDMVIDAFTKLNDVKKVLVKGSKKAIVILKSGIQVDIRVFHPDSWGAGLFYNTGSKNYNILMRREAIKYGWKLNEYGLFNKEGRMLAGETEEEICRKLRVKFLKPEEREM